jgi:hypothetical protein
MADDAEGPTALDFFLDYAAHLLPVKKLKG